MVEDNWKNEEIKLPEEDARENPATLAEELSSPRRMPVVRQLGLVAVVLVGIFSVGLVQVIRNNGDDTNANDLQLEYTAEDIEKTEEGLTFDEVSVGAQTAIVFDVRRGEVLYEKDPDREWPLASITKLMTALIAREIMSDSSVVSVSSEALSQSGDSGLLEGENFSYNDFSGLVLMSSSNDGAYALAATAGLALSDSQPASAFVKAMNVRAKELGLENTYFRNPTGLDISETDSGAYGTAREVSELMAYLVDNYPAVLEETTMSDDYVYSTAGEIHNFENTNVIADSIPGLLGSKTGYTTLAGGNLVVAFDAAVDRPIVVVVLGSSHQGRFSDVLRLIEATRNELSDI